MTEFVDMDYAEVEALWKQQQPIRGNSGYVSQLREVRLERGVPVSITTRADVTKQTARQQVRHGIRKALEKLGYEDWQDVMVVIHDGKVIVCRPFGEMAKRAPTLREIDSREERAS